MNPCDAVSKILNGKTRLQIVGENPYFSLI